MTSIPTIEPDRVEGGTAFFGEIVEATMSFPSRLYPGPRIWAGAMWLPLDEAEDLVQDMQRAIGWIKREQADR